MLYMASGFYNFSPRLNSLFHISEVLSIPGSFCFVVVSHGTNPYIPGIIGENSEASISGGLEDNSAPLIIKIQFNIIINKPDLPN